MSGWPILSLVTFLPLVGALFILFIRGDAGEVGRNARNVALLTSATTFLLSLLIWVQFDPALNCLYMNPGAAGRHGWHQMRTALRFTLDGRPKDLEVVELGRRAAVPGDRTGDR